MCSGVGLSDLPFGHYVLVSCWVAFTPTSLNKADPVGFHLKKSLPNMVAGLSHWGFKEANACIFLETMFLLLWKNVTLTSHSALINVQYRVIGKILKLYQQIDVDMVPRPRPTKILQPLKGGLFTHLGSKHVPKICKDSHKFFQYSSSSFTRIEHCPT